MSLWTLHLAHDVWHSGGSSHDDGLKLKGQCYLNDCSIDAEALAVHLAEVRGLEDLGSALQGLNGFYAWIEQSGTTLRAGVDHVRSQPLFYGQAAGHLYLSDDAEWVRQQVKDQEMDPVACEEFQLAGYVTGNETLFPHVKQLQAGECLLATHDGNGLQIQTRRYYRFLHMEPDSYDEAVLREQLDQAVVRCIQRLIDYADGRQIVVPLSGGYDSRLIVTLLKRLGYDNVLTFTYGVPGNKESEYSQKVANALGLRWHFVEYSEDLWREAWQTPERWEYQKWASGWNSIAHVQDWLAVKVMKAHGVPEPDCLFVPGHSGDFVAGSHIPANAFERTSFTLDDAADAVFSKHYGLAPLKFFETSRLIWAERIRDRMERDGITAAWQYADVFEKWDWQERQAKYICNSIRVYEFFGFSWWMPFWDKEFIYFWQNTPLKLRKNRQWYNNYVALNFETQVNTQTFQSLKNASDTFFIKKKTIDFLAKHYLLAEARAIKSYAKKLFFFKTKEIFYKSHFVLTGYDYETVLKLEKKGYYVLGIFAKIFFDDLIKYK